MRLHEMIGETLIGDIPALEEYGGKIHFQFKLVSVDVGGIWIECQSLIDYFLKDMGLSQTSKTPILFVPFASIKLLVRILDVPALSETALGLRP